MSPDAMLRAAQRAGDTERERELEIRFGMIYQYDEPLGPPSIMDAVCAYDGCNSNLTWSNCSFCRRHHDQDCTQLRPPSVEDPDEHCGWVRREGVGSGGRLVERRILSGLEWSCNAAE